MSSLVGEGRSQASRSPQLARNTIWSLIGYTLPFPVALIAIPLLTRELGTDRFGVLSLAWALIGYSSIFDLGLGRALTKVVAERLGSRDAQLSQLVWSTLALLALIGAASCVVVLILAPILVERVFQVPESLREESLIGFRLMALSIPFITMSAGLRGLLEAHQAFRLVGAMNSISWSLMLLAPLAALPFANSLVAVMLALLAARVATWAVFLLLSLRRMPTLRPIVFPSLESAGPALKFGGWLTVSNIVGPFLTYFDRFVIGSLFSVSAVAFYSVPYDMVLRLTVFASAVTSVLFPTFSASYAIDRPGTVASYQWGLRTITVLVAPLAVGILLLAPEGLSIWLGQEFAEQSTHLLRWLTVGVFISCLVQVPFSLIQAAGRPDLTARLHVIELMPYLLMLWVLSQHAGITGVAIAWTLRVSVDALLILFVSRSLFPEGSASAQVILGLISLAWLAGVAVQASMPLQLRLGLLTGFLIVYMPVVWKLAINSDEKQRLQEFVGWFWAKVVQKM